MPGIGGLSVANNLLANSVQLNLNQNQSALQRSVSRLSSGLRINTAADDPSGLAIAEKLQAQVDGFDQAARNVQDASNAATVAEGALQTTTDILQRVRTLAVEAASDITSSSDKQNLQSEVNQLLLEVNRIAENTQFNGIALLDGSHAGFQPEQPAGVQVATNAALATTGPGAVTAAIGTPGFSAAIPTIVNSDFSYPPLAANSYTTDPTSSPALGWDFSTSQTGVLNGNGSVGWPPPPAPYTQAAYLQTDGATPQTVSQTLSGFQPGAQYAFTFYGLDFSGTGLSVYLDGQDITPTNIGSISGTWQQFTTQTVSPGAGDHTLSFVFSAPPVNDAAFTGVQIVPVAASAEVNTGLLVASVLGVGSGFQTTFGGVAGIGSGTGTVDGTIEVQVVNTGVSIAAQETFFDSATGEVTVSPTLLAPDQISSLFDNVQVITGSFSTVDVGSTSYIKVSQNVPSASNPNAPALSIQSGAAEGATIQIGIPATNTAALRVSNVNLTSSTLTNPSLAAQDAIGQIDVALQIVLTQRAQLGAITVRLGEDQDNDNAASVNLQASESAIRDLNVAQETTNLNHLQILVQVGTSVLAQANTNAQSVLHLFP